MKSGRYKMKLLFICNQNQYRSPTAELLFKDEYETKSAGLYSPFNQVTERQIEWADIILVMEEEQRTELSKRFPKQYMKKRILNLNIPDIYQYNDPALINELKRKIKEMEDDKII